MDQKNCLIWDFMLEKDNERSIGGRLFQIRTNLRK